MHIRAATVKDSQLIIKLGQNVSEFSVNKQTVIFWPEAVLHHALSSDDVLVFVAEDTEITGFIIATYNKGFKKSTIENVYVTKNIRNQGVGTLLLKTLLEELAKKGCEYVAALVPTDADGAVKLYETAGFSAGEQFLWLDRAIGSTFKRT